MIFGIGTDITSVERITKAIKSRAFFEKIYTTNEQAYITLKGNESAAGFFAAKEAFSKALGTGIVGFSLKEVEVAHNESGMPYLILSGKAKDIFISKGIKTINLSLSHEHKAAVAFVVLEV